MKKLITRRDFLKKTSQVAAVAGLSGSGFLLKGCKGNGEFDIVLKGGNIIDGLGNDPYVADIGISGNAVKKIGKIPASKAKSIIEAKELTICPGFIDAHDHTDVGLFVNPKAESSVRQGITTLVSGNCGSSPFPVPEDIFEEEKQRMLEEYQVELTWTDINSFFGRLEEQGMAVNYSTFLGQGTVRGAVVGFNDRPPTADELKKMRLLVADNIKQGALGLSSGLEYAPGSYAGTDEIVELCQEAPSE